MSRIVRWNPVREMMALQNAMERLLDEQDANMPAQMRRWDLAVDMAEMEDHFMVKASLPGINPDQIEITVENDVLTIKGETQEDKTIEEASYHVRERRAGSFARSLRFPTMINPDKIEATYEHGVLTLNIPKAEAVKPKKIAVRNILEG